MRKTRSLQEGAIYHVIARVNRRERILNAKDIKDMLLSILKRAKGVYRFCVRNFCIMGNHIHLVLQPLKGESLSKIMQWILSVFARSYNRRFDLMGHVWYDRFKSFILSSLRKFLETFVYITLNPVKAGIVSTFDEFFYSGATHLRLGLYDIVEPPDIILRIFAPTMALPLLLNDR